MSMKCKICGYTTPYIENMAKHYRRDHPNRMKRDEMTFTPDEVRRLKRLAHATQNL